MDAWKKADIWLYPCIFQETFCLTALEAAATQTLAVCSDLAALQNTVGDRGVLIPGDPMTEEWRKEALKRMSEILEKPSEKQRLLHKNKVWARDLTWENQAQTFSQRFLDPPYRFYRYEGQHDWTVNHPPPSKQIMKYVLSPWIQIHHTRILEWGCGTGTSLCGILTLLPKAMATAVLDLSENDPLLHKKIHRFHHNLDIAGVAERVSQIYYHTKDQWMDSTTYPIVHIQCQPWEKRNENHQDENYYLWMWSGWQRLCKDKGLFIVSKHPPRSKDPLIRSMTPLLFPTYPIQPPETVYDRFLRNVIHGCTDCRVIVHTDHHLMIERNTEFLMTILPPEQK